MIYKQLNKWQNLSAVGSLGYIENRQIVVKINKKSKLETKNVIVEF